MYHFRQKSPMPTKLIPAKGRTSPTVGSRLNTPAWFEPGGAPSGPAAGQGSGSC